MNIHAKLLRRLTAAPRAGNPEAEQRARARAATEWPRNPSTRPDDYRDLVRHGRQDWHGGNEL